MTQQPDRKREIYRVTWIGSIVNLLLLIFKFAAGIIGHSAAMIADAVHSLSDFVTDIVVVIFVHISGKPEDKNHGYGHCKYETLATAIIGIMLFAVGVGLLYNGTASVIDAINGVSLEAPRLVALIAAFISIVTKEILYRYTVVVGRRVKSEAVVANAWHHRSDTLSSIGTLVGIGGAIYLGERWHILDPIAAIVVSIFIVRVALKLLKQCIDELMERSLPDDIERHITEIILSFDSIDSPHHLRTRRIGSQIAIEVHIRMDGSTSLHDAHEVASAIEHRLKEEFGEETHIGIHMEPKK